MDNYFDLHFHPITKNFLGKFDEKVPTERGISELTKTVEMSKAFMDFTDEPILRMLESQCAIEQLEKGKVTFGVAVISALEFGIAAGKSFFTDQLKNSLAKPYAKEYFEAVTEGEVSYLNLFLREIDQYRILEEEDKIKFLNYDNVKSGLDEKSLNLVFGIEGGHNLCTKLIGNALASDKFENFDAKASFDPRTNPSTNPAKILEGLVNSFRKKGMDILYLTLTHLTHIPEQHLATHAFGTKMLRHPSFYPFGNGLSDLGKEVIRTAYTAKVPAVNKKNNKGVADEGDVKPVLIDIKHMSLKSRLDLYEFRKQEDFGHIPLIATHVGVTGYSINDWRDSLDLNKSVNHVDQGIKTIKIHARPKVAGYWGEGVKTEFTFNPCTMNLMDEDIIAVVNSGGIIGVGLDVRLLGYESKTGQTFGPYEFLSTADFITHFPYNSIKALGYADAETIRSEESWLKPTKKETHPLSFCLNIVHLLAVIKIKANQKNAEKFVCIGSDFDGFIEPLKICSDSRQMKDLESNLLKWLPVAAKKYQKENGGASDLFEFVKKEKALENVVKAILYESGSNFVINHFASEKSQKELVVAAE